VNKKHYLSDPGWLHIGDPDYPYEEMEPEPHVCTDLDQYGYCRVCGKRVLTQFKGWPLPDRPT